jgi:hypothetical protein
MKKLSIPVFAIILLFSLNSCGVNNAFVVNTNQNSTQVSLSQANYKVVGKASGTDEVSYVLIFGGMRKKQLYANAYARMVEKADLSSGAKALTNLVTEEHVGGVPPFYYTRTITVSANVIEFTK